MNQDHDKERIKDEERHDLTDDQLAAIESIKRTYGKQEQEDDWLDISKVCNLNDPECDACQ